MSRVKYASPGSLLGQDLAAVRAERDLLQQEVEEHRDQARRQHGWTPEEIATLHRLEQQHMPLGSALTQALQALAVDPLVLSLAQVPDSAAAFAAQWRDADGAPLTALAAQVDRARDYDGVVQHWEQQVTQAQKDLAQVNTFFGRIFHADRLRAARQQVADKEKHLASFRQDAEAYHARIQRYQRASQTEDTAWQALQPHVEQTRTALAEACTIGTLATLVSLNAANRQHAAWAQTTFRRQLVAEARTLSSRILTQRVADWRTPDVFTRFMEQLNPTLQDFQAERRATAQRDATMRARRAQDRKPSHPPKSQEDELEL
ncbi:hypothetical protein [Sulfobacillus sp. hq2]|uniref:hypothetical protein n=1 Tax=Sulfobacillus TaxID=28033 RepID=UPI0011AF5C53|nr:hypothetical protein [Sulfobacillus sp. hq2]